MTDEQAGKLLKILRNYHDTGTLPELDFGMEMALTPFINQFKRDEEKYLSTCERNRLNGKKGGRNRKNPVGSSGTQSGRSEPKKADSDSDSDSDSDNKNDNNKYIEFLSFFNQLKGSQFKGSDKVKKSFNARLNDGYSLEDIKTATLKCFNTVFHQENPKYLTPEFILRPDKMEMYLNAKEPQEQQKPIPNGSKFTVGETDKLMTQ